MIFPFVFSVPNALVNTKSGFEISSMQRSLILLPDIERRADGSHFTKSSLKKIVPRCSDREKERNGENYGKPFWNCAYWMYISSFFLHCLTCGGSVI